MLLKDKVAIVTGAGRGIGKGIALKLSEEGAITVINDIEKETAKSTGEEIMNTGRDALVVAGDVSNENDVKSIVDETIKKYEKIDILVNNAGLSIRKGGRRQNLTEINDAILEHIPLGRFGVPEEVGDAVVFLASDKSGYITGTTFNISGGYVTS